MFSDITKPPPPLPATEHTVIAPGVSLLRPLSRRGHGPGILLLTPDLPDSLAILDGVPAPMLKWAEEGYTVVEIQAKALLAAADSTLAPSSIVKEALEALTDCEKCEPKEKVGLVAYEPSLWNKVAPTLQDHPSIVAAVLYADARDISDGGENPSSCSPSSSSSSFLTTVSIPVIHHLAGKRDGGGGGGGPPPKKSDPLLREYIYPTARSYKFAMPFHQADFHYNTENVSHTRSLTLLKAQMGGPYFDLETIWEEHTWYEFADRSMEHTMATMVQEPYVNHIPTVTGGVGRMKLSSFYQHNFIFNNSADTELELISRTLGIDRIIDEFIFKFTHDQEIDWLLPGVPPTHKHIEAPFSAVVNVRGDRLYHEHISWDQGTVLRQAGLLPEYLPFPYALPEGRTVTPGKTLEYRVPVTGIDTARKMRDRNSVPSNEMFEFSIREV